MASITQSNSSYSFVTPIKLDQNHFILWRTQVLASIKGNGLEGFINGDMKCPEKFISFPSIGEASTSDESRSENPKFIAWMKTDQLLLSWMMSSIQQSLLSTVIDCATSKQLWESLNYTLALAGKPVELGDFIMHVLTGLDSSDYESLITTVLAREGIITKNSGGNFGNDNNSSNFGGYNGGFNNNGGSKFAGGRNFSDLVCQICFIPGHGANRCKNRFNPSFVHQKNFGRRNFRGQFGNKPFNNFGRGPNFSGHNFGNGYMPRGVPYQANMAYSDSGFLPGYTPSNYTSGFNMLAPGYFHGIPAPSFAHNSSPYYSGNFPNGVPSTSGPSPQATCAANPEVAEDPSWYIDSGATNHITNDLGNLVNPKVYVGNEQLYVGDGNALLINHVGSVKLTTNTAELLLLNHVLHVPKITKNLLSVSKLLADNNVTLEFVGTYCFVQARSTGIILLEGVAKGGLYKVQSPTSHSQSAAVNTIHFNQNQFHSLFACLPQGNKNSCLSAIATKPADVNLLHRRLGHPAAHILKTILSTRTQFGSFNKIQNLQFFDACQFGKNHMLHFNSVQTKTIEPLQLLYANLWGPSHVTSTQGYVYYLSILDDFSRFTWIFPLSSKSDALTVFAKFKTFIEKQLQKSIKVVQTDWGGEFRSFSSLLISMSSQTDSVLQSDSENPSVIHLQTPLAATSTYDSAAPVLPSPQVFSQHSSLLSDSTTNTSNHTSDPSPHSSSHTLRNSPPHILPASSSIGHSMVTRSKNGIFKPKAYLLALLAQPSEPTSVSQALTDPKWLKAMQEEFQALQANHTWELVLPKAPVKVVGNKWVFRIKYNPDGSILKHKARLVAKGFHQVHGIDYTETFSPVVKASTVRVVLSIAVMNNWILRQIDVNNAFLNGILDEEVYMAQPEDFVNSQKPQHICKLRKAIYGLKQQELARVQQVIQDMQHTFALKDLGELSYFLGIEVSKLHNGIHLSQAKYIADILLKHDLTHCSPVSTPMSTGQFLTKASGTDIANVSQYRSIIGALQYAGDRDDRKLVAGFAVFLGPNLVSWSSKKQSVVSRSSAEAEYRALAHAASEVVWIKSLLAELQVQLSTTPLMWDKVASKEIDVCFVPSEDQTADVLTKALTFNQFHYLHSKLNVQPKHFRFRGDVSETENE
ncbi:retrovirus-related pol polyprotein from transposon RE1 [Citrus sinensis]|nr:retrovirus-related pol polyprotein from transposon RE1 [Citrus sinensis]